MAKKLTPAQELVKSKNALNKFRYEASFKSDYEPAPDLGETLALGGFDPFELDTLKELPEVIRPLLSSYDSIMLDEELKFIKAEVPGYQIHKRDLPLGLIDDIYNLYYNPAGSFTFVEANLDNSWRITLVQRLSHYYMRALTERSTLFSFVVARELSKMLLEQLNPNNPNAKPPDIKSLDPKMLENLREKALDKAQDTINQIAEAQENGSLPQDGDAQIGKQAGDSGTELQQAKELLKLLEMMKRVSISSSVLNQFVKQSLKMSTSYFSGRYTESEIDLFEAEEIDDMMGIEYLCHPILKKMHLQDLVTHEKHYHIGFDVYIDRSGSMTAGMRGEDNKSMSGIDLVKLTACILLRKKLARNVYFFDTTISKAHTDQVQILQAREGGGTTTEIVVKRIEQEGVPALILTDMQDHISTYTPLAYFIGVLGATMYPGGVGEKYLANGQFSVFDGKTLTLKR